MQRHVMEYRQDFMFHQMSDHLRATFQIRHLNVEHMRVMLTFFRNLRKFNQALLLQWFQTFVIRIPARHAIIKNTLRLFQFRIQIRRIQFARQIARTEFYPSVLIDFATVELHSVCSLFTDDFRTFGKLRITNQKRSAFAHAVILGLMIAVTAKVA